MPVSEIGLLRLRPTKSVDDPELLTKLKAIQQGLQDFTGYPFYFLQQKNDPHLIYLLGEWESLDQHYKGLHGSSEFKERVGVMMEYFEFQWMAHYGFDMKDVDIHSYSIQVIRFCVDKENREDFDSKVQGTVAAIGGASAQRKVTHGWKLDEKTDKDEFVVLLSWENEQASEGFARCKESKALMALGEFAELDMQEIHLLKGL